MFNLSGSEIVFILLLALIVLGPEKLPDAVRRFGKAYAEFKKMSSGFQSELKSALDEPMREMRETADAFKQAVNFDFVEDGESATTDSEPVDAVAAVASTADEPSDDEPSDDEAGDVAETVTAEPTAAAGNEPPLVRPPGPTFHSAAPQEPKVIEAVEETASE